MFSGKTNIMNKTKQDIFMFIRELVVSCINICVLYKQITQFKLL